VTKHLALYAFCHQEREEPQVKKILVTIKDCELVTLDTPILKTAIELAKCCSSRIHLIHVAPASRQSPYNIDSEVFRREIAAELRREHNSLKQLAMRLRDINIDARALLVRGVIITAILEQAERLGIDMLIVGRHKHGPLYSMLMDDTDEGLLARSSCPVLFIPVS
jgi:nucleotide-binding universal stress UspA family protein